MGLKGGGSNDIVLESISHMRSRERTNGSHNHHCQLSGCYPHYPQQYLMAMQQQLDNNNNFYSFLNSSPAASTAREPSSSPCVAEIRDKVENSDPPDGVPPPFFDFLGVGATWDKNQIIYPKAAKLPRKFLNIVVVQHKLRSHSRQIERNSCLSLVHCVNLASLPLCWSPVSLLWFSSFLFSHIMGDPSANYLKNNHDNLIPLLLSSYAQFHVFFFFPFIWLILFFLVKTK